jgi:hypothetical protein
MYRSFRSQDFPFFCQISYGPSIVSSLRTLNLSLVHKCVSCCGRMLDSTTVLVGLRSCNTVHDLQHDFFKSNFTTLQSCRPEYNKRAGVRVLSHDNLIKIGHHTFSRLVRSLWCLAVLEELTLAVRLWSPLTFLIMLPICFTLPACHAVFLETLK